MISLKQELSDKFTANQENNIFYFTVPQNLSYFKGHFPDLAVLPAVGFVDISLFLVETFLSEKIMINLKKITYLKIKNRVYPGQNIQITFEKKDEQNFLATWRNIELNSENQEVLAETQFTID